MDKTVKLAEEDIAFLVDSIDQLIGAITLGQSTISPEVDKERVKKLSGIANKIEAEVL